MHRRRLLKPLKPPGFHDACNLLVIDRAEIRIVVETCSDAFSTIKPVLRECPILCVRRLGLQVICESVGVSHG